MSQQKKSVGLVALVAMVAIFWLFVMTNNTPGTPVQLSAQRGYAIAQPPSAASQIAAFLPRPGCTDSDNVNYFTAGDITVVDPRTYGDYQARILFDRCLASNQVLEYSCDANNKVTQSSYVCATGAQMCVNGACITSK